MGGWAGSTDINYPAQPTYGEGMADALKAQVALLTGTGDFANVAPQGLAGLIPLEKEVREQYTDLENQLTRRQLLGSEQKADEQGRIITGYTRTDGTPATSSDMGGLQLVRLERRSPDDRQVTYALVDPETGEQVATGSSQADVQGSDQKAIQSAFINAQQSGRVTASQAAGLGELVPTYEGGYEPGESIRGEGLVDLFGPDKARQIDPETGKVTGYGQAGFTPEGEFKGLVGAQQEAQQTINTMQRASDIADVELLGGRATEALRAQGDIQPILNQLGVMQQSGQESTQNIRNRLLGQATGFLTGTLTGREARDIAEASRSAGVATGRIRDTGRVVGEVADLVMGNRQRQIENLGLAQGLLGNELGIQQQQFGQAISRLGAEQATAADPIMSILGRPANAAPGAQSMLASGAAMQQGAGPQFLNPEAGLGYIQNQSTNAANVAIGQQSANAQRSAGLMGAIGTIGGGFLGGPAGAALGNKLFG